MDKWWSPKVGNTLPLYEESILIQSIHAKHKYVNGKVIFPLFQQIPLFKSLRDDGWIQMNLGQDEILQRQLDFLKKENIYLYVVYVIMAQYSECNFLVNILKINSVLWFIVFNCALQLQTAVTIKVNRVFHKYATIEECHCCQLCLMLCH